MNSLHPNMPTVLLQMLLAAELRFAQLHVFDGDGRQPIGIVHFKLSKLGNAQRVVFKRERKSWVAKVTKELAAELRRLHKGWTFHVDTADDADFRLYRLDEQKDLNAFVQGLFALKDLQEEEVTDSRHAYDSQPAVEELWVTSLVKLGQFWELFTGIHTAMGHLEEALEQSVLLYGADHAQTRVVRLTLLALYSRSALIVASEVEHSRTTPPPFVQLEVLQSKQLALLANQAVDAGIDLSKLAALRSAAEMYWLARRSEAQQKANSDLEIAFCAGHLIQVLERMDSPNLAAEKAWLTGFLPLLPPSQKVLFDKMMVLSLDS